MKVKMPFFNGIMVANLVDENEQSSEIKCIFCGNPLRKSEMVRYRGSIACRECAEKQRDAAILNSTTFYYLAAIGCLVALINFIYFTFHGLVFLPLSGPSYVQPLVPYFLAMTVALILISFGLFAISRENLPFAGIIGVLVSLLAAAMSAISLHDFVTNGLTYILDSVTYTKTLNYYSTTLATYSLFCLIAGIVILLHITDYKTENTSIVSASFFLISAFVAMTTWTWIYAGFIHAFTYAVTFAFFITREKKSGQYPIESL
jgi:hypothetical protein